MSCAERVNQRHSGVASWARRVPQPILDRRQHVSGKQESRTIGSGEWESGVELLPSD